MAGSTRSQSASSVFKPSFPCHDHLPVTVVSRRLRSDWPGSCLTRRHGPPLAALWLPLTCFQPDFCQLLELQATATLTPACAPAVLSLSCIAVEQFAAVVAVVAALVHRGRQRAARDETPCSACCMSEMMHPAIVATNFGLDHGACRLTCSRAESPRTHNRRADGHETRSRRPSC